MENRDSLSEIKIFTSKLKIAVAATVVGILLFSYLIYFSNHLRTNHSTRDLKLFTAVSIGGTGLFVFLIYKLFNREPFLQINRDGIRWYAVFSFNSLFVNWVDIEKFAYVEEDVTLKGVCVFVKDTEPYLSKDSMKLNKQEENIKRYGTPFFIAVHGIKETPEQVADILERYHAALKEKGELS